MAEARKPAVFNIPVTRPFADTLVAGLLAAHGADRLALARGTILVPNNRAGLAIRDAFVRQAEGGLLLPRLVAIGDPDLDERVGAAFDAIDDDPIPPAIDPLARQFILARMLQRDGALNAAEAMRLAADLARVIDQLIVDDKTAADLREIDAGDMSEHWQAALERMKAVLDLWPRELAARGRIDLSERRNRLLKRVAERWKATPPPGFVVAAGISITAPAVASLLRTVALLPQGRVVVAGLDPLMPEADWAALSGDETTPAIETHPQFHLRQLLDRMGVGRGEVSEWSGRDKGRDRRAAPVSHAFALPASTRNWPKLPMSALEGLTALELATPAEEAQAIALAIREAVETPERTVALVTSDRDLASRVAAHLGRWGIAADDSAGRSLAATPPGALMYMMAEAAAESFAPAPLMALLKHPLVRQGETRLDWLDGARRLDLALRGPRPEARLDGVSRFLGGGDSRTRPIRQAAAGWWEEARALLEPLANLPNDLPQAIAILRETATALAGDSVWSGQDGRALADLIADLEEHAATGPALGDAAALPALLRGLMEGIAVRPGYGGHPRVFIWGLIEARLQSADLLILGGLNEGVWPQLAAPDPWLAPRIRRELGLPGLERRIGLSAHDLASAMGAPEVLLTRATRDARSPTIASRFWLRIEALTGGLPEPNTRHDRLARAIDGLDGRPDRAKRPRPAPPAAERPRDISVTDVDRLTADPYAFYAKAMLRLNALDPLDADPGPAWRGSLIHEVLDGWTKQDEYAEGKLVARMEAALSDGTIHPLIRALWSPRLTEAAQWIEARVGEQQVEGRKPLKSEVSGKAEFAGVTIRGRADRIDRLADGSFAVIDYKTGEPPKNAQIAAGFAMQLGLIGLIAERGGFEGIEGRARAFEYWSLARDAKSKAFGKLVSPVQGKTAVSEPEDFVAMIAEQFRVAAADYLLGDKPFTAKLAPDYAWSDYDQLMRLEEWEGRDA